MSPKSWSLAGCVTLILAGCPSARHDVSTTGPSATSPTAASTPAGASAEPAPTTALEPLVSKRLPGGFVHFDDGALKDSMPPFEGVIVPEVHAKRFHAGYDGPAEGYWSPSVEQALAVGKSLSAYVEKKHSKISERLHSYRYQLVGYLKGGRRLMFVNAFCQTHGDWKTSPIMVDDGGDCYFQLTYDPATQQISRFQVNGDG